MSTYQTFKSFAAAEYYAEENGLEIVDCVDLEDDNGVGCEFEIADGPDLPGVEGYYPC